MRSILARTIGILFTLQWAALAVEAVPVNESGLLRKSQITPSESTLKNVNFEGTVALSNCSGSIVRFEQSDDNDKALVMTNGHCIKFFAADEVMTNVNVSRSFMVKAPDGRPKGFVNSTKIVYGTMTKTDLAFYELEKTYREIKEEFDTDALVIQSSAPKVGEEIEVISGYWTRGYACSVEEEVHELKEDRWTWSRSLRYSRPGCETIGGTSGSPVVLKGTRTAVAVNNTGNENGRRCTLNNPCEVDKNQNVSYVRGYSYAQQIHWVYSCLNQNRQIDLDLESCELPKPAKSK